MNDFEGNKLITQERVRQVLEEGHTPEHDDVHDQGELILAAIAYCEAADYAEGIADAGVHDRRVMPHDSRWPWKGDGSWNPEPDPVRNLAKAGALISAEIDRLLRAREDAES